MNGIFLIIAATICWAIDTLFRYPLLFSGYATWHIVWMEHLLLVLIMVPWMWNKGLKQALRQRTNWLPFFVIGGLGSALGTLAFTQAFSLINPTVVILLQKLQPLIAITLAWYLLKEQITRGFLIGAAICVLGSLLLVYQDIVALFDTGDSEVVLGGKGVALALVAVVCWGSATVFGKKLSLNKVDSGAIVAGRFLFGFAVMMPWLFIFPADILKTDGNMVQNIVIMVILSGVLGMTLYYQGLKRVPSRVGALAEMFFPIAAISVNWIFLDAALTVVQLTGAVLLSLGSMQAQRQRVISPVG